MVVEVAVDEATAVDEDEEVAEAVMAATGGASQPPTQHHLVEADGKQNRFQQFRYWTAALFSLRRIDTT